MKKFLKKTFRSKKSKSKDTKSESKDPDEEEENDKYDHLSHNVERRKVGKSNLPGTSADTRGSTSASAPVLSAKQGPVKTSVINSPFLVPTIPTESATTIDPYSSEDSEYSRGDAQKGSDINTDFLNSDSEAELLVPTQAAGSIYPDLPVPENKRSREKSDSSDSSAWDDEKDVEPLLGKADAKSLMVGKSKILQDRFNSTFFGIENQLSQFDELFHQITTTPESGVDLTQANTSADSGRGSAGNGVMPEGSCARADTFSQFDDTALKLTPNARERLLDAESTIGKINNDSGVLERGQQGHAVQNGSLQEDWDSESLGTLKFDNSVFNLTNSHSAMPEKEMCEKRIDFLNYPSENELAVGSMEMEHNCHDPAAAAANKSGQVPADASTPGSISGMSAWDDSDSEYVDHNSGIRHEKGDGGGLLPDMSLQEKLSNTLLENQLSQSDERSQQIKTPAGSSEDLNQPNTSANSCAERSEGNNAIDEENPARQPTISNVDESPAASTQLQVGTGILGSNCLDPVAAAKNQTGQKSAGASPPNSISDTSVWDDEEDYNDDAPLYGQRDEGLLLDTSLKERVIDAFPINQPSHSEELFQQVTMTAASAVVNLNQPSNSTKSSQNGSEGIGIMHEGTSAREENISQLDDTSLKPPPNNEGILNLEVSPGKIVNTDTVALDNCQREVEIGDHVFHEDGEWEGLNLRNSDLNLENTHVLPPEPEKEVPFIDLIDPDLPEANEGTFFSIKELTVPLVPTTPSEIPNQINYVQDVSLRAKLFLDMERVKSSVLKYNPFSSSPPTASTSTYIVPASTVQLPASLKELTGFPDNLSQSVSENESELEASSAHSPNEIESKGALPNKPNSGTDLDVGTSAEVFGAIESDPKLEIDNGWKTLFEAPGKSQERSSPSSVASISETSVPSSSSSKSKTSPFPTSKKLSNRSSHNLSFTTSRSKYPLPTPLSTILFGVPRCSIKKTSKVKGVNVSRRFSSPNTVAGPLVLKERLHSAPDSLDAIWPAIDLSLSSEERVKRILAETKEILSRKVPSRSVLVDDSNSESSSDGEGDARARLRTIRKPFGAGAAGVDTEDADNNFERRDIGLLSIMPIAFSDNDISVVQSEPELNTSLTNTFYVNEPFKKGGCSGSNYAPRRAACRPCKEKNTYQSGSIARYCDALMAGTEGNAQMVGDIIQDLQCVFAKTFGSSQDMESKYECLLAQLKCLQKKLCKAQQCKNELQKEICRLQSELQAAQFAFEEEVQRRICLEKVISQLRAQLNRLEILSEKDMREIAQLSMSIKELDKKLRQMTDLVECLQQEKDELLKNCQGFDEWKNQQNNNMSMSAGRIAQLEEALAKCCKANEDLQKEVCQLRKERDCLKSLVEQLQCEKQRMAEEFECERQCWAKEKACLEKMVCDMKKSIDCLTGQNKAICDKMNQVVRAHHTEMDCLKKQADKYKKLYECEKEQREKLERALQDCEERKKEMLEQQQKQMQLMMQQKQQDPCQPQHLTPCSDVLNQYSSDGGQYNQNQNLQYNQDLKARLQNADAKIAGLEKDLQYAQTRGHEQEFALDRSVRDLEQNQATQRSLEIEISRTREEVSQIRAQCEALKATNTQLQIQLEARQIEKIKTFDDEKLAHLSDENRRLIQTVQEERATRELYQRELKDAQRLWEVEVKAKGILADRITRYERTKNMTETKSKEENSEINKLRETLRLLKSELKVEREQVNKLKLKIDTQKEQLRCARDALQEVANDPRSKKLIIDLDQMKNSHANFVAAVNRDQDALRTEISKLEQGKFHLERELKRLNRELTEEKLNKDAVREVMRRKDRLENEVGELKTAINERYVERSQVDRWKSNYEARIETLRSQYEAAVQAQVKAKLLEMQLAMDRQGRDRAVIDKMRESNDDIRRNEYNQMTSSLRAELDRVQRTVRAKEEEISTLQSQILLLKKRYSSEATMKEELLKKLQGMSAASRTSVQSITTNNNNK